MHSQKRDIFKRILSSALMLIASCLLLPSQPAQPSNASTEIVIIGTVHKETNSFKTNDLVTILMRVMPDIILCEYDHSFFTKDFQFVRNFGGLEQTSVISYAKNHQVLLRPYDIEGRNEFYSASKSFEREDSLIKGIRELARGNKLDSESQKVLDQIRKCMSDRDRFLAASPRDINSFECDRVLAQKTFAMDFGYSEIIHRNLDLFEFSEFWNNYVSFESRRNLEMIRNIEHWAGEFKGKRIVVLCGFEHRHQLRLGLRIHAKSSASLKEYWEYPQPDVKPTSGNASK